MRLDSPRTTMLSLADEPRRHPWVWLVYAILFIVAVPWYLPPETATTTWLGFPLWVTLSLAATLGVALFTVFVIHRYWSDDG
jgi:hypothetical protein